MSNSDSYLLEKIHRNFGWGNIIQILVLIIMLTAVIVTMNNGLGSIDAKIDDRINSVNRRIDNLEDRLEDHRRIFREHSITQVPNTYVRKDVFNEQYLNISEKLDRIDERINDIIRNE